MAEPIATPRLAVLVPQLPPAMCGVGDYTARLLELLGHELIVSIAVLRDAAASREQFPALPFVELAPSVRELKDWLQSVQPEVLLVQYSAYGFDPKGCPVWLLQTLAHLPSKVRVAVMFHELWSVHRFLTVQNLIQALHRHLIRKMLARVDVVFTNTQGYCAQLAHLSKRVKPTFLPIPSTIPVATFGEVPREKGLAVLFGRQGTRIQALKIFATALRSLVEAGLVTKLVTIGGGSRQIDDLHEDQQLEKICRGAAWQRLGRLSAPEVSRWLQISDFAVSTQDFLSFSKSTTFMAYAAHGAAIVSPFARESTEAPFCWLTSPDELLSAASDINRLLDLRRRNLQKWYQETMDWPILAETVSKVLQILPQPEISVASPK